MMRLVYLTANAAWAFTFGDDLIRMGSAPMFHPTRRSALDAALDCGLFVTSDGRVLRYGVATVREDSCGECAVNGDAHEYWGD